MNDLGRENPTEAELRKIARDKSEPVTRRAAAERMIRMVEAPDLADFEEYLESGKKLGDLRREGVNTEAVKKAKVKVKTDKDGGVEIERELELYDRAGTDFDRVMDRTIGKPTESLVIADVTGQEQDYTPEEYGRLALSIGVPWEKLPPEVQAVTPRPITATVKDAPK